MKVELLFVAECPNVGVSRRRIAEAAAIAGVDIELIEREIADDDEARALGMRGSPTILIDGRDVDDAADSPSISCRLYADGDARQGAPTVAAIERAIQR